MYELEDNFFLFRIFRRRREEKNNVMVIIYRIRSNNIGAHFGAIVTLRRIFILFDCVVYFMHAQNKINHQTNIREFTFGRFEKFDNVAVVKFLCIV